ncbi:MAG: hypothetical protein ACJAR8_002110, partial [Bacteroidia bacterium]
MKRVLLIAWVAGVALAAILAMKLAGNDAAEPEIELLDIAAFIEELEQESDQLFTELSPIGFDQASHAKALELRKERWYILSIDAGTLTYWNSNKVGIDTTVLSAPHYPILYLFGDDLYAVFQKSHETYFSFRLANEGQIHARLAQHASVFNNKHLIEDQLPDHLTSTVLPFQTIKRTQGAFLNLALICSFLFLFFALWYANERNLLMYVAAIAVIIINILTYFYLKLPLIDYFFIASESMTDMSTLQLNVTLYIHLASLVAGCLLVFSLVKKLPKMLSVFLLSLGVVFLADFFLGLSAHIVRRSAIPFDFEKLFNLSSTS